MHLYKQCVLIKSMFLGTMLGVGKRGVGEGRGEGKGEERGKLKERGRVF